MIYSMKKNYAIIAFATTWGSKFGGINAFNTDLLQAIATAHWQRLRVICVVADCDASDIKTAKDEYQIELVNLKLNSGSLTAENAAQVWSTLADIDVDKTVWLGHDRITGAIANAMATNYGGRSTLIHHMSYSHYESFAENSATASRKAKEQQTLFTSAHVQLAVGPLLREALADFVDTERDAVPMLTPGLAEITPKQHHHTFTAFISGRLDIGAQKIKQAHLGVAGFAHAVFRCDNDTGLPDKLKGDFEPKIKLRGIDLEINGDAQHSDVEQDLKRFVEEHAQRVINLQALPFTQNRNELFEELRQASVCLMPSWHEGFGLVAWEAIAAGVPLIVSCKSGVYRLLKDRSLDHLVCAVDIRGKSDFPFFADDDKKIIATKLIEIAKNHAKYKTKALQLREVLLDDCTWRACADSFIQALEWPVPSIDSTTSTTTSKDKTANSAVSSNHPLYQWLEQPKPQWQPQNGHNPSRLLRAEEALISFAPEGEPFLQTQCEWATTTSYPIGVRLLIGEGGAGKTRLALEMLQRLSEAGWHSGFLRHSFQPKDGIGLVRELQKTDHPTLIVLDYAETRSAELLELLAQLCISPPKHSIRILLLARSSGEWWGHLPDIDSCCETLLTGSATTGPYTVPGLYADPALRQKAYAQALATFAHAMQCPAPNIQPDLQAAAYDKPLYLHMSALLALLGERTESADALPMALVRHERNYWRKAVSSAIPASSEAKAADSLMALVTLLGTALTPKSIEALWRVADGDAQQLKPLFAALAPLYPGTQGLSGLRPDLLGEALVAQQLLGINGEALLNAVLGSASTATQRHHALTVLSRLLRYREDLSTLLENALTQHFPRCAKDIIKVAIQTPSPLPKVAEKSFQHLSKKDALQVAGQLENDFEYEVLPLIGLELLTRQVLNTQAQKRCEADKKLDEKNVSYWAKTLNNLSVACYRDGDIKNSLKYAKLALDIREKLAKNYPERFDADWAKSLSNYAAFLNNSGDLSQALQYAKQAVDIRERLTQDKPERFEAYLAKSLSNYAAFLNDNGNLSEALQYAKQGLDIRERLAQKKPERFEADWASSLNNYAHFLGNNGDFTQALQYAKQALDIYQRLAKEKLESFQADWAMSLNNYAHFLGNNGDFTQALQNTKQALDIRERLMQDKPERFEADWAASLNNYAIGLADNGEITQALQYAKQALDVHEKLAKTRPDKYISDAEGSHLLFAMYAWLAGQTDLVVELEADSEMELPYAQRGNRFDRNVLLAFAGSEIEDSMNHLGLAWQAWAKMSHAQQTQSEAVFLLACAFASAHGALPDSLANWQEQLMQMRERRKGQLPAWMQMIAERKGFTLA